MRMKDWNDEPESNSVYIPDTIQSYVNKLKLEMDKPIPVLDTPTLEIKKNDFQVVEKVVEKVIEKVVEKSIPCKVILQNLNKKCDENCSLLTFPFLLDKSKPLECILFYGMFGDCTLSLKHNDTLLSSTVVKQNDKPQFVFLKNFDLSSLPDELVALELVYDSEEKSESTIVFVEITF